MVERVVADRMLITSQSPGTAMEFALTLVETFAGPEKMREIKRQTLAICAGDNFLFDRSHRSLLTSKALYIKELNSTLKENYVDI